MQRELVRTGDVGFQRASAFRERYRIHYKVNWQIISNIKLQRIQYTVQTCYGPKCIRSCSKRMS